MSRQSQNRHRDEGVISGFLLLEVYSPLYYKCNELCAFKNRFITYSLLSNMHEMKAKCIPHRENCQSRIWKHGTNEAKTNLVLISNLSFSYRCVLISASSWIPVRVAWWMDGRVRVPWVAGFHGSWQLTTSERQSFAGPDFQSLANSETTSSARIYKETLHKGS